MKRVSRIADVQSFGFFDEMLKFEEILKKTTPETLDDDMNYIETHYTVDYYDELANLCIINSVMSAENIKNIIQITYKLCMKWPSFKNSLLYVFGSCDVIAPYSKLVRGLYQLGIFTFAELVSETVFLDGFHLMFAKEIGRKDIIPNIPNLKENDWAIFDQIMEYGYEVDSLGYSIITDNIEKLKDYASKEDFNPNQLINQPYLSTTERSLLMTAIYFNTPKCIDYLIEIGAEFNHECLAAAVAANNRLLIDKYKDKQDINYDTCTFNAVWYRRDEIFDEIMEKYDGKEVSLYNCIHMASYKYVYYFTENGAPEAIPGCEPALVEAAKDGELTVVQYLISKKFDLNIKNEEGDTALHFAVHFNRYSITKLLLENGANVNVLNEEELTPVDIARRYLFEEVEKLLIKYGGLSCEQLKSGENKEEDQENKNDKISEKEEVDKPKTPVEESKKPEENADSAIDKQKSEEK